MPRTCEVTGCDRYVAAHGMCQTHRKQFLTTGTTRPIRHYRTRTEGNVRLSSFKVSSLCAEQVKRQAHERGLSIGAAITEILEGWNTARTSRRPRKR
jgi:hypothetical protein